IIRCLRPPRQQHRCLSIMPDLKQFQRLPKTVIPVSYDIWLKPNLKTFKFDGKVNVQIEVVEATQSIVLNAVDLEIAKVIVKGADGKEVTAENVTVCNETETATFKFLSKLSVGSASLFIDFVGELNDHMKGFYRSSYTAANGEQQYSAATQFESTDARRAFPCWDEPAIKSKFDVTLVVPKDKLALSNMKITSDEEFSEDSNLRVVKFGTSPIMSTYLLAFVVGEYDHIEDVSKNGVVIRVYTPINKKEQGRFALQVAVELLSFYEKYFKIAFPLPKLDLIALADFASGAMENWGLITYREQCLLIDPENSSSATKERVAIVVAHELAHQWFGNLVTMEWWTHLWLNEGFASFMENFSVDHMFPEYDLWTQFCSSTLSSALKLDALESSHAIEVEVGHPDEVNEIFDNISYQKGSSVIRMLYNYITDKCFQDGLHHYLTKFSYKNAITEDLWASLGDASGKPINKIMNTWTKQVGFPMLSVTSRHDGGKTILTISQKKFSFAGSNKADKTRWMVPVSFSCQSDPSSIRKQILLSDEKVDVEFDGVSPDHWIKLNVGTVGFYRVQYSTPMMEKFLPSIKDLSMPSCDRYGLLDDIFATVVNGYVSTVDALTLIEAYVNETNYTVWTTVSNSLGQLKLILGYADGCLPLLFKHGCKLFSNVYKHIGWDAKPDEAHTDTLLRSLVIGSLVSFQDETVLAEAKSRFYDHLDGTSILPADLRTAVYKAVMSQADEQTFDKMLELYRKSDLQEEKNRIGRSLGSVNDDKLIGRVLDFSVSKEVRTQDSPFILLSASMNSVKSREKAWNFFKD
ncbi:NPEPPS (predicted), partial [Pycnogonum litorale]